MYTIEDHNTPQFGEMWQFIGKILNPIGMMPDKASLDHKQTLRLYFELKKTDNTFRDLIQIHILKNELAYSLLGNLVN
jgi:hypothetical protein